MLWIALLLLLSWMGAGALLLWRGTASRSGDYRRQVGRRIYAQGQEVEVTLRLVPPFQANLAGDHDVLLALDRSVSMGAGPGSPLQEAVRAAENFVRRCPPTIHVGLVAFDHEAQLASLITGEHRRVLRALGAIGPGGGTAIHEALDRCQEALEGGRLGVPKIVILLSDGDSDRAQAAAAAERLRAEPSAPLVICIGFGPGASEELLTAVAGAPERYRHVSDPEALNALFGFLASFVSGQMAVAGVVDEGVRAPDPFRLARTGGLHPVGVRPGEVTRIVWSVPLMDLEPVALSYHLVAGCPGWHPVASADSKAVWRMPDAAVRETPGPQGPRILVLPELLTWAWPLLNPLFWMLFGRFFCRARALTRPAAPELPAALPEPSLPAPLPEAPARPYQPAARPALVLGLGELGAWAVCRLKHRLQDREIGAVELLSLSVGHSASRAPVQVGGIRLEAGEHLELPLDLRPYVETLRGADGLGPRAWVPWREWLLAERPLHTAQGLAGDRRKARLALLLAPGTVEERIRAGVERVLAQDGVVVIVSAAAEAEGSGLLGEVAHMCATHGGSATAILTRGREDDLSASPLSALAAETERMVALRGDTIPSDRHDPPVEARQLFDRIIVLPPGPTEPRQASEAAGDLIWSLLAYRGVQERIPTSTFADDQILCCELGLDAQPLPASHLWRWVRERTLALAVNGRWLGLQETAGTLRLPPVSQDLATEHAEAFWRSQGFRRPRPLLLAKAREILDGQNPVVVLMDQLPVDGLYDEQAELNRSERRSFAAFCEEWCQSVLDHERERGSWGLPVLAAALLRIDRDVQTVLERIDLLSGNEDFRNLTRLASTLLLDVFRGIAHLRAAAGPWIVKLAGEQVGLEATAPAGAAPPLSLAVEEMRGRCDAAIEPYGAAVRDMVEKRFGEWFQIYGENLLASLRFQVAMPADGEAGIRLRCGERLYGPGDDLEAGLREAMDRYRGVMLSWPLHQGFSPRQVEHPADWFRVGQASAVVYPQVSTAVQEEDPFFTAAFQVRKTPLRRALGVAVLKGGGAPFVWPEETNAEHIAEEIRSSALREPRPFSPLVVQLMRDPLQLYGFLVDVARGALRRSGAEYFLTREDQELPVGRAPGDLDVLKALESFQEIARRVVTLGKALDGRPIPEATGPWALPPEEAMEQVESHPLVQGLKKTPEWAVWRDVLCGLALEAKRNGWAYPPP